MVWWIVAAVIVLPLLLLAAVLAGLRRRLVELDRVAALGQERVAQAQPKLLAASERLQTTLTDLERTSLATQRRLAARAASRARD